MPDANIILSSTTPKDNVSIYIPCHYDFSQLEYVGPFLERYHGSKVFIYKWNGLYDEMKKHYQSNEYQAYGTQVYDFSLQTICHCIANEPPGRKVIFLLTAGMAYWFGKYQKILFSQVRNEFPDVVWGVSVVGHCMYGCMSCAGVDHKVPVYYSRYFRSQLTYTAESIQKEYFPPGIPRDKFVLVAPSIGETSMLQNREMLDYLKSLQDQKRFFFLFKLHPASFNTKAVDMTYAPDVREHENVLFIMKHFAVSKRQQPCLLPFVEASDTILCDLHSSVGFISSYFAPRRIFAYHNDTGYDVPERDAEFLANFYIFDDFKSMQVLFNEFPPMKGSNKFFTKEYGIVDGRECDRFAALAKWPTTSNGQINPYTNEWRGKMAKVADFWYETLLDAYEKDKNEPEEEHFEGCKEAIGFDSRFQFRPETITPRPCLNKGTIKIKVLTFNIWIGGEAHPAGIQLERIAEIIDDLNVDIVGLQEVEGKPKPDGHKESNLQKICDYINSRHLPPTDSILSSELGCGSGWEILSRTLMNISNYLFNYFLDKKWSAHFQGILTPGPGCGVGWGILTRLPVKQKSEKSFGIKLEVSQGLYVWLFNTHLPYFPYQPYQISHIPYERSPFIDTEFDAIESSRNSRHAEINALLEDIKESVSEKEAVLITGDFNEPSHLDWTCKTAIAGYHPLICEWPETKHLEAHGFIDAYRFCHPNNVSHPGFTWCPRNPIPELQEKCEIAEHHDRIDFVFARGVCGIEDARIVGCNAFLPADLTLATSPEKWPTDHQGVVVTLSLP